MMNLFREKMEKSGISSLFVLNSIIKLSASLGRLVAKKFPSIYVWKVGRFGKRL
jgi:hypothetical protein